ncbi:MAG: hypothetical protein DMG72_06455 [Acidobacteria bacterium]|nr:MAG: hypothetical protein DMG72_06455 [Acidobacteriota bacterium]
MILREKIEQEIRERGPIPFSRYMEMCLYHPELGYYSRQAEQFGKAGDFYTSSDVHAVFGRLLARQFEEMWRVLGSPEKIVLLEFGPGRGLFAQDVLHWSRKKFPEFFDALHYALVESSPALQQRLERTLSEYVEAGKAWLCPPDEDLGNYVSALRGNHSEEGGDVHADGKPTSVPVLIFANEFFDALPFEVISSEGELRIDAYHGHFVETWAPASRQEVEFLDRYSIHPDQGERVEAPLIAQQYMSRITKAANRGFILLIDYGYTRDEQLAGRHRGTITAFRQHSVSADPYEAPGEQDITAHVNFTALSAVAERNGMQVQKLLTQSQFLMGIGETNQFADAFEECRLPQERAKVALQLKHLVTPAGMGESFHVLLASKGVDEAMVAKLAGMSFTKAQP